MVYSFLFRRASEIIRLISFKIQIHDPYELSQISFALLPGSLRVRRIFFIDSERYFAYETVRFIVTFTCTNLASVQFILLILCSVRACVRPISICVSGYRGLVLSVSIRIRNNPPDFFKNTNTGSVRRIANLNCFYVFLARANHMFYLFQTVFRVRNGTITWYE